MPAPWLIALTIISGAELIKWLSSEDLERHRQEKEYLMNSRHRKLLELHQRNQSLESKCGKILNCLSDSVAKP
jgi:hypothetical protein